MQRLLDRLKDFHHLEKEGKVEAKILDIGGWFAPCSQATAMVDIMPFETMNRSAAYGFSDMKIEKKNYHQVDISSIDRLPFADKEFDFVICRHTLEDIMNPIKVCEEMIRVAKAGYIETPSRIYESTKGVERPSWCGHYHHRWFVEVFDNEIIFPVKPHNLHFRRQFYFRRYPWQKFLKTYQNVFLEWEGSFSFKERVIIDLEEVKKDLSDFKKKQRGKKLFRFRWANDTSYA